MRGTEKTVPINEPDDLAVAFLKLHGGNGSAFEAGKTEGLHTDTLPDVGQAEKASRFALWGKFATKIDVGIQPVSIA
jgi:hypothetical protein